MQDEKKSIKPIFRWAGSKRRLIPTLLSLSPKHFGRYIEPFFGSGCLFFAMSPKNAILGDINEELITAYKTLRDAPEMLAEILSLMPLNEQFYYDLRAKHPSHLAPLDRTARFIYLNRYCFNGVYRTNRDGLFNVPRGKKTGKLPSLSEITTVAKTLCHANLFSGDFEKCVKEAIDGDFVYLDPPYTTSGVRDRGEYGPGSFSRNELPRLITTLQMLTEKSVKVLLSYSDTSAVHALIDQGWYMKTIQVQRSVAGFANKRSCVPEIILANYDFSCTQ